MSFFDKVKSFVRKYFFNPKWKCNSCGKEIFEGEYFCPDCEKQLPFNDKAICEHCGRQVVASENYCSTCKESLLSIDKGRSVFVYDKPISAFIKNAKYDNKKYLLELFARYLSSAYLKHYFNADYITYIPMTEKALKKRGYNQSQVLANLVGLKVNVEVIGCLEKTKETDRQAKLTKLERLKNLEGAFKVVKRKEIKDKVILIIDDVTTTGATAENVAKRLKNAGAKTVYLLTVASVPPKDGY